MYGSVSDPCPSYSWASKVSVGVIYLRHGSFRLGGIVDEEFSIGILATVVLLDDATDMAVKSQSWCWHPFSYMP